MKCIRCICNKCGKYANILSAVIESNAQTEKCGCYLPVYPRPNLPMHPLHMKGGGGIFFSWILEIRFKKKKSASKEKKHIETRILFIP